MLTTRQRDVLLYIQREIERTACAPTLDMIGEAMGLAGKSNVHRILTALERRGYIERQKSVARAIRVLRPIEDPRDYERYTDGVRAVLLALSMEPTPSRVASAAEALRVAWGRAA
jgi:repressor LexA